MHICDVGKCTGCFACLNICPHNAIDVKKSIYGEFLPQINENKCVSCGLCQKICPSNSAPTLNLAKNAYAAWSKDVEDVRFSSSGGVAAVFSRYVLELGGVVYGAAIKDAKTIHIRIDNKEEINKLRGSKYVQSEIGLIYKDVKEQLNGGSLVLFIGTPCQIAGLKAYLIKDYENLILVDLICHGTPPHTYLEEHLNNRVEKWDSYSFRGQFDFQMAAYNEQQKVFLKDCYDDEYFTAFLDGLTYRNSCYICQYAQPERVSDITIGDFWGINRKTLKRAYNGRISLILPNTQKGIELIRRTKDLLYIEEREISEAMNQEQGNLLHPSVLHPDRDEFLAFYIKHGFDRAVRKTSLWKKRAKEQRIMRIRKTLPFRLLIKAKKMISRKK